MTKKSLRIGCGAGFSSDRLPPAVDLVRYGELDAIIFECVAERTLAFGHRDRKADPSKGYNPYLSKRMEAVLPYCHQNGVKLITNMGVANPIAAGKKTAEIAKRLGLSGLKIAVLIGDDVSEQLGDQTALWEGGTIASTGLACMGANVYLGAEQCLEAMGADVIITGRIADPSLVVTPLIHHFGWDLTDWDKLGAGTLAGHLIECGMQITGGYFADPGLKDVPDLANCGFPIAEITNNGEITITKLPNAGGLVSLATVKEQMLYEVHDPSRYLTPDVTADFSSVSILEGGPDQILLRDAAGYIRPEQLKVTVGFDAGFQAEAGVSYAGVGAGKRAMLARDVLKSRLAHLALPIRFDIIGLDSIHSQKPDDQKVDQATDVRLRVSMATSNSELLEEVLWETEALLCCGPSGGGGFRRSISPSVVTCSASINRDQVKSEVIWL